MADISELAASFRQAAETSRVTVSIVNGNAVYMVPKHILTAKGSGDLHYYVFDRHTDNPFVRCEIGDEESWQCVLHWLLARTLPPGIDHTDARSVVLMTKVWQHAQFWKITDLQNYVIRILVEQSTLSGHLRPTVLLAAMRETPRYDPIAQLLLKIAFRDYHAGNGLLHDGTFDKPDRQAFVELVKLRDFTNAWLQIGRECILEMVRSGETSFSAQSKVAIEVEDYLVPDDEEKETETGPEEA